MLVQMAAVTLLAMMSLLYFKQIHFLKVDSDPLQHVNKTDGGNGKCSVYTG